MRDRQIVSVVLKVNTNPLLFRSKVWLPLILLFICVFRSSIFIFLCRTHSIIPPLFHWLLFCTHFFNLSSSVQSFLLSSSLFSCACPPSHPQLPSLFSLYSHGLPEEYFKPKQSPLYASSLSLSFLVPGEGLCAFGGPAISK